MVLAFALAPFEPYIAHVVWLLCCCCSCYALLCRSSFRRSARSPYLPLTTNGQPTAMH